ncbi:MAG: PQQ-binding-like beta-propeller repeat protein [Armatimonadetes bacterium]|nr:PQQ-binding-like beta-propeller repeat protein [Armatimonadota bacterium]
MKKTLVSDFMPGVLRAFALRLLPVMLCIAVCWPAPADAAGYLYAGKRKTVNCGILWLDMKSTGGNWTQPVDAAGVGNLFNLLDYYTEMKPAGWSLDNPYAPVDETGVKYPKSDPRFWKIPLASARNLSRMHVLYLPAQGHVLLSDDDREKLRRFVDSGGVLWIDNTSPADRLDFGAVPTDAGTFFISKFYFTSPGTGGYDVAWSRHHPILTLPYWIDDREILMIGANWGGSSCVPGYDEAENIGTMKAPITTDILFPIVAKSGGTGPSVVANTYGSGRVVATANYAGKGCFLPYPQASASLKLAYNIIAWSASWTDLRKNPRRSAAGIDTVGGTSLVKVWSAPVPANGESGAVIYKNMVFYSSGNTVYAFDVMPSEDLDRNGNSDDGSPDVLNGFAPDGQDLIWKFDCDSIISAPTVVTCQDPTAPNKTVEAVLVLSDTGKVYMLDAFPRSGTSLSATTSLIVPVMSCWESDTDDRNSDIAVSTPRPSPPICVNGWIYIIAGDGRLYARNPALEKWQASHTTENVCSKWIIPGRNFTQATTPKSGPMFGYVNASNGGAVIGMVYWCVSAPFNEGIQQEQNDYIYGVPVYVKNDRLRWRSLDSTGKFADFQSSFPDLKMVTDPAPVVRPQFSSSSSVVSITSVQPNMSLINDTPTARNGFLVVETSTPIPTDTILFADYSLDYSVHGGIVIAPLPRIRAPLIPSSISAGTLGGGNGVPKTEVSAMPAMGPDNVIYIPTKREATPYGAGGSVYSIKNDGSSGQSTKWNYMLHSGLDNSLMQGVVTPVLPVPGLLKRKPLGLGDLQAATISKPQAYGSPVVYQDKVFVTVSSQSGQGGALLCFKANSDFVIRVMQVSGVDPNGTPIKEPKNLNTRNAAGAVPVVKIWQPNLISGSSGLGPSVEAINVSGNMLDREKGTITFSNFNQLKLRGGVGILQETNTFSSSLPVWVTLDEVEIPIDWNTWGPTSALTDLIGGSIPKPGTDCVDLTSWNNLLWYYVPPPEIVNGNPTSQNIHSSPVLIGNCVYFITDSGKLYAVDAETGETRGAPMDPFDSTNLTWAPNPKFVIWEEPLGGGGGSTTINLSPSGSNGVLMVPMSNGLNAYANPTTLVADSNRLVEVDSSGNVSWSLDSVQLPVSVPTDATPGVSPLPRRAVPINKPARARFTETGEILLVNTGSNMVCKTDKSGSISIQQIEMLSGARGWIRMAYDHFTDPKQLLRPGQPLDLNNPTDALVWSESEEGANSQVAVIHCIVADSGNSRVLDLVYRFNNLGQLMNMGQDQDSGYYLPELNWVSNTESKAERYVFECLQLAPNPRTAENDPYTYQIWAAISNYRVDSKTPNPQGLGGAIVGLNYRTRSANATLWNYSAPNFPAPVTGAGKIASGCERITIGGSEQPFACPRFFQVRDELLGRFILVCDNRGVYKIGPLGSPAPPVMQQLLDADYRAADRDRVLPGTQDFGAPLLASSVQELPNGKWLIANSYSGTDKSGTTKFSGEIFEFDPGLPPGQGIVWSSPKLQLIGDDWKQTVGSSYKFQQPRSAFRGF